MSLKVGIQPGETKLALNQLFYSLLILTYDAVFDGVS